MPQSKPLAFLSFVSSDVQHEEGRISQFRERLADEVSMRAGQELTVFQDRDDILWSQYWKERVEDSLDAATLLIAFITPWFFLSQQCRGELAAPGRSLQKATRCSSAPAT